MSSLSFGRLTHTYSTIPSTQDAARALVEKDGACAAGVVCSAMEQTAGRGRQGRTWFVPPGANVCSTFIGRPVALEELWQVSFLAAVAAADAIAGVAKNVPVRLRFPNDVLLNGKKVCGILVETATGSHVPPNSRMPLIGIGINVRGGTDALPPEVAVRATTIEAETGVANSVGIVGSLLSAALTTRWNEWRTGAGFVATLEAWHRYHDPGARRMFFVDGAPMSCGVLSVSPDGNATIELPDATRRAVPVPHILLEG